MKILFSSSSSAEVGLLKSVLDEAGIACEVRNESSYPNLPGAPFQPEIWVLNDEDYEKACKVLDGWRQSLSGGAEQSHGSAVACVFIGFLMVTAAVVLASQHARTREVGRLLAAIILFGLVGAILLWGGAAELRGRRKKG